MDERTLVSEKLLVPQVHWTAKVSCVFSVCTTLLFLPQFIYVMFPPVTPLYQFSYSLMRLLQFVLLMLPLSRLVAGLLPFSPVLSSQMSLSLISFIFAAIALIISFGRQWRKGRWMALVGVILPGIVLTLYGALIVFLLFFWHPHLVF